MGRLSQDVCVAVFCVLAALLQPTCSAPHEQAETSHFTLFDQPERHREGAPPVPSPHSGQRSLEQRGEGIPDILGLNRQRWEATHGHPAADLHASSEIQNSYRMKRALSLWGMLQTSKPSLGVTGRPRQPSKGAGPEGKGPARPVGKQPLRWGR